LGTDEPGCLGGTRSCAEDEHAAVRVLVRARHQRRAREQDAEARDAESSDQRSLGQPAAAQDADDGGEQGGEPERLERAAAARALYQCPANCRTLRPPRRRRPSSASQKAREPRDAPAVTCPRSAAPSLPARAAARAPDRRRSAPAPTPARPRARARRSPPGR